jgi:hypothetical protein
VDPDPTEFLVPNIEMKRQESLLWPPREKKLIKNISEPEGRKVQNNWEKSWFGVTIEMFSSKFCIQEKLACAQVILLVWFGYIARIIPVGREGDLLFAHDDYYLPSWRLEEGEGGPATTFSCDFPNCLRLC